MIGVSSGGPDMLRPLLFSSTQCSRAPWSETHNLILIMNVIDSCLQVDILMIISKKYVLEYKTNLQGQ